MKKPTKETIERIHNGVLYTLTGFLLCDVLREFGIVLTTHWN